MLSKRLKSNFDIFLMPRGVQWHQENKKAVKMNSLNDILAFVVEDVVLIILIGLILLKILHVIFKK